MVAVASLDSALSSFFTSTEVVFAGSFLLLPVTFFTTALTSNTARSRINTIAAIRIALWILRFFLRLSLAARRRLISARSLSSASCLSAAALCALIPPGLGVCSPADPFCSVISSIMLFSLHSHLSDCFLFHFPIPNKILEKCQKDKITEEFKSLCFHSTF